MHLILGGNDFLKAVQEADFKEKSAKQRIAIWKSIQRDLQTIVNTCLAMRESIRVVIAGYDYLDHQAAETFWKMDFKGASITILNTWFTELGKQKQLIADNTHRCEYLVNWGQLQYWFGEPAEAVKLPGGDITAPMPKGVSPDGIHPNEKAHAKLLQRAIDEYYREWLR